MYLIFRNIGCPRKSLAGFSGSFIDPYYEIDPLDQGEVHFNNKSDVNNASEEHVEKKIYLLLLSVMMIMMENSFLGPLAVLMIQKKKMMKR